MKPAFPGTVPKCFNIIQQLYFITCKLSINNEQIVNTSALKRKKPDVTTQQALSQKNKGVCFHPLYITAINNQL